MTQMKKLTTIKDNTFSKLPHLRKEMFYFRENLLLTKGLLNGTIQPFNAEFYQEMNHTYVSGLPIAMHIKYLKPTAGIGKCYERSMYMFWCFDDAVLVRGNQKALALKYGQKQAGHGWMERGDWAYDPTFLMRFKKDLYYKIFGVSDTIKCTKAQYLESEFTKQFYDEIKSTTLADFQPNGRKRLDLLTTIPLVRGIAAASGNETFKADLDQYLTAIQYDEKQIYNASKAKEKELLTPSLDK